MKGNKFRILSVFVALLLVVSSCEKTPIEQSNEDYNWSKLEPGILGKSGPASMMRTYTGTYSVAMRGGSVFTWTVVGADLVPITDVNHKTDVFFPTDNSGDDVLVVVYETTHAGLVSAADTFKISVTPFIAPSISGGDEITIYSGEPNEDTYSVSHREGSTYAWSTTGGTIAPTSNDWEIDLEVTAADVGSTITLTCNETHLGSLNDTPSTIDVLIKEFCAMTIDEFLGTWTGTEVGDCNTDPFSVTFVAGTAENTIVAEATAGTPAFLACIFIGWGEVFQAGFGNEGDVILTIGIDDGTITIADDYWGQTLPGPYDYQQAGSGTWTGCGAAPSMTFEFGIDASMWRKATYTLTKVVTK
jgi:hypothetical protein